MNRVLASAKYVASQADHVKIDESRIPFLLDKLQFSDTFWLDAAPFEFPEFSKKEFVAFLLVLESVGFSYWGDPRWTISYKGKPLDGSWAMIASILRAREEGNNMLSASFLASLDESKLAHIFRGNTTIPLFAERLHNLQFLGKKTIQEYNGDFLGFFETAKENVWGFIDNLITILPFFDDFAIYKGEKVYFLKLAQLTALDVFHVVSDATNQKTISQLTALADYKVPMVLRHFGVLSYETELEEKVDSKAQLESGSSEEVEIRSCTIWAVHLIAKHLQSKGKQITDSEINNALWLLGQDPSVKSKPYHLTRTTKY